MRVTTRGVRIVGLALTAALLAGCGGSSSGSGGSPATSINTSAAASAASSAGAAAKTALVGYAATNEGKLVSAKVASCMPAGAYEAIITPTAPLSKRLAAAYWLSKHDNRKNTVYPCFKQKFALPKAQHDKWVACIEDQAGKPAFWKQLSVRPSKSIAVIAAFVQNQVTNCYGVATGVPDPMGTAPATPSPASGSSTSGTAGLSSSASPSASTSAVVYGDPGDLVLAA